MTTAPEDDLQAAVVEALKADAAVTAFVGARIYDRIPDQKTHPFVEFGDAVVRNDGIDCAPGACTITFFLHVWSRAVGSREAKKIAHAIHVVLDGADLALGPDWVLVELEPPVDSDATHTTLAEDGKTTQSILTFRALVDPAA